LFTPYVLQLFLFSFLNLKQESLALELVNFITKHRSSKSYFHTLALRCETYSIKSLRDSKSQKCITLFGSQIEVAAVNRPFSLVNEFAKVPSWVASTTSWGFRLTRCFGKLEDTLLSLISFHGYWVPLFTNKRMRGCQRRT